MKLPSVCSLILISLALAPFAVQAQDKSKPKIELRDDKNVEAPPEEVKLDPTGKLPAANKEEGVPAPAPNAASVAMLSPALQKLPSDQLQNYFRLKDEATSYMRTVRLQESLDRLNQAEKLVGDVLPDIENLRGAVYTKMRDFKMAREHFQKALSLQKDNFHPKFNLAELDFVEKKWSAAQAAFGELILQNAKNKEDELSRAKEDAKESLSRQFDTTERLMQFKILICQLQQQKEADASETMKSFKPYDNDSPAYYFAKAAADYIKEKKEDAEEWINSAKTIYPADMNEIFIDSLVEMGWLQTLN